MKERAGAFRRVHAERRNALASKEVDFGDEFRQDCPTLSVAPADRQSSQFTLRTAR